MMYYPSKLKLKSAIELTANLADYDEDSEKKFRYKRALMQYNNPQFQPMDLIEKIIQLQNKYQQIRFPTQKIYSPKSFVIV